MKSRRAVASLAIIGVIVLFLSLGIWLAAVTAVAILHGAASLGGGVHAYLNAAGGDRVMRRCLMGWAAVFLVGFLKVAGWRGWRDCGFTADDSSWSWKRGWRQALLGAAIGLLTLGSIGLLCGLFGARIIQYAPDGRSLLARAVSYLGAGLVVALIEETVCRGILFRLLARLWRAWPAALITSLLFALAHFLSPDPRVFLGPSFWATVNQVFVSTLAMVPQADHFSLRFLNLTLLGLVFCAFVARTGAIWLGVGAHAAWVWVIKFHWYYTDTNPAMPVNLWLGSRGDFMDSVAAALALVGLIVWAVRRPADDGLVIRGGGLYWQVQPQFAAPFRRWLEYDFDKARNGTRILKTDSGTRIAAHNGWVLKQVWPRNGWRRIRFAFRPSRARRTFRIARQLLQLGLPTPAPVAWAVQRRWGLRQQEFIVTEEIQPAEPLTDRLQRHSPDPAWRRKVMAAYGRLMAAFHRNGYSNRDFKHENAMCSVPAPDRLWVVDLDGVRHPRWVSRRRAARDLFRVGSSLAALGWNRPEDVRAFFEAYNADVPPRLRRGNFPL